MGTVKENRFMIIEGVDEDRKLVIDLSGCPEGQWLEIRAFIKIMPAESDHAIDIDQINITPVGEG